MRINRYVASASGLSRRSVDMAILGGRVRVNDKLANIGQEINEGDTVKLDGKMLSPGEAITILLNKPPGYVCSRAGQGNKTVYDLLPPELYQLKPIGRLDKDSSGLLLLTNDGVLANKLTHPKFAKEKAYEVEIDRPLVEQDQHRLKRGVSLDDGLSVLQLTGNEKYWTVKMKEGRNRQIRRTFAAVGYSVVKLHRTSFGGYQLANLKSGDFRQA